MFIIPTTEGLRFKLRSAVIPICWYATNSTNNVLQFTEGTVSTVKSATVPQGNYAIDTLATALTTAMNSAWDAEYTCSGVATTGKISVVSVNAGFQIAGREHDRVPTRAGPDGRFLVSFEECDVSVARRRERAANARDLLPAGSQLVNAWRECYKRAVLCADFQSAGERADIRQSVGRLL